MKLCPVAVLLTPTTNNISVAPTICLTAMCTLPVVLSTEPPMHSAHKEYKKKK
jgi:hypothetical protein